MVARLFRLGGFGRSPPQPKSWRDWFLSGGVEVSADQFLDFIASVRDEAQMLQERKAAAAKPSSLEIEVKALLTPR
jgi:hypothetical protein